MPTSRTQNVVFNSYLGSDFSLSLDSKLGCNLNNTQILDTIPTAPTTSQGTYIFKDPKGLTHAVKQIRETATNAFNSR